MRSTSAAPQRLVCWACGGEISFRPVRGIQLCDTHALDWLRENKEIADHQARYGGDAA